MLIPFICTIPRMNPVYTTYIQGNIRLYIRRSPLPASPLNNAGESISVSSLATMCASAWSQLNWSLLSANIGILGTMVESPVNQRNQEQQVKLFLNCSAN